MLLSFIKGLKEMKEKLTKLIDVKSISTIVLVLGFIYGFVVDKINAEQYMNIFTVVIAFYFGVQYQKSIKE